MSIISCGKREKVFELGLSRILKKDYAGMVFIISCGKREKVNSLTEKVIEVMALSPLGLTPFIEKKE